MNMFKKTAFSLAIASISAGVHAELKALDDQALGAMTGQAGLTIDLETKYTIGEFMYKDAGSVFLKGISFGGNTSASEVEFRSGGSTNAATQAQLDNGLFDNVRVTLDIAGNGAIDPANGVADNYLETGFSGVRKAAKVQAAAAAVAGNVAEESKFVLAELGQVTISDAISSGMIASNATTSGPMSIGAKKTYGDGDLLIHVSYKDAWQKLGGASELLASGTLGNVGFNQFFGDSLTKGKDFNFSIDAIGLASSAFQAGDSIGAADIVGSRTSTNGLDADASTTVLISDLSINGFLGPVDIHIENKGNGFGMVTGLSDPDGLATAILTNIAGGMTAEQAQAAAIGAGIAGGTVDYAAGVGDANSKINWNTYVNVTDLDVYLDIAGVYIEDLKINNVRGDVTDLNGDFAFGFAQSNREIYAVRNAAGLNQAALEAAATAGTAYTDIADVLNNLGEDGVAINTTFKGDMEIGALSFGDTGTSIGQLYWTDIESTTNWTISAH